MKKSVAILKGDIKSDGKYDTRATEAGRLARAQKRRVEELETPRGAKVYFP
ncbi:hypothetical protein OAK75_10275 [Bacteriovoracales bacterium]|nr:hypothetical protein [Bacteriovoracales bacterium]